MTSDDEFYMSIALRLARRGLGRVWPNPAVGAVLVAPGRPSEVVGRGWTMPGGRPHAETVALERAGERARGATLFVTLEPCAHHGKTPPCADAIMRAGVARVVCALDDPDSRVAGKGYQTLKDAGIAVETGILRDEAALVTRGHLLRVTEQRPEVTLKLAVGSDGLIAPGDGAPVWVTGEMARARGHLMRARADAILVGRGTVDADDPALTCRLPGMEDHSPVRVVLDSRLRLGKSSRLFSGARQAPVWVICTEDAAQKRKEMLEVLGVTVIPVQKGIDGRPDPRALCRELADKGITRLLVEGGPTVARSFLDAGLADIVAVFRGASAAGAKGLKPFVSEGLEAFENENTFKELSSRRLADDSLTIYEKRR